MNIANLSKFTLVLAILSGPAGALPDTSGSCEGPLLARPSIALKILSQGDFQIQVHEFVQREKPSTLSSGLKEQLQNVANLFDWLGVHTSSNSPYTVFYPAASHDASTPLQLFPNAQTVVAIDWGPFQAQNMADLMFPVFGNQELPGHLMTNETQGGLGQSQMILGRLALVVPNFRILKITSFKQKKTMNGTFWNDDYVSHGLIEFDQGEGTSKQYYLHLQVHLDDRMVDQNAWWVDAMLTEKIGAIIIKGSADLAKDAPKEMADFLFTLAQSHGLLIEEELGLSSQVEIIGANTKKTYLPFGYRKAVVHSFESK